MNTQPKSSPQTHKATSETHTAEEPTTPSVNMVHTGDKPYLDCQYAGNPVSVLLSSGSKTNLVRTSFANKVQFPIQPSAQVEYQYNSMTTYTVKGKVSCQLSKEHHVIQLDALVVDELPADVLAGSPFLVTNDISVRPAKCQIIIGDSDIFSYANPGRYHHTIGLYSHNNQGFSYFDHRDKLSISADLKESSVISNSHAYTSVRP